MLYKVVQVRLYPTVDQQIALAQTFGCARWWYNHALNKSIETYRETGNGLGRTALNALLPNLKKEYPWLSKCYSQVLQATTPNLTQAYKNFFEGRAKFPKFKSKNGKQSIQYPQNVKVKGGVVKIPGSVGEVKAKIHRLIEGKIKTVTVSKTPSGKYFASLLTEVEGENPTDIEGAILGIDLGILDFCVVHDGSKKSKYSNPKHLAKHEQNLKRKQQKLARKQKGSSSRNKYRKVLAKVYERVSNSRQDFLHKLSYRLVNKSQVVVVENLHVKGMVTLVDSLTLRYRNHNLAEAISDCGWGMFINFLSYKLERKGGKLVEIDRWFPSSKLCSNCFYQMSEMPLDVREWTCPHCLVHHDRDGNASANIRSEGIRMLKADGSAVSAVGGEVRPKLGRKPKLRHLPLSTEASGVV